MKPRRSASYVVVLVAVTIVAGIFVLFFMRGQKTNDVALGVTFSKKYAEQLNLDWREVFTAMIDDLHPAHIRLPIYWSDIEPEKGLFVFDDYDWMLSYAEQYDVKVTLAIGRKVPRWPECYQPDWIDSYGGLEQQGHVLTMLEEVVNRYKDNAAVYRWQVENEPFLAFGVCPETSVEFFREEINKVRSLDDRPIVMTTSGELEPWFHTAPFADHVGFSLYRLTWNDFFGFSIYPIRPAVYKARVLTLLPFVDQVYVSELQAEPWFHRPVEGLTVDEQVQMFSPKALEENVKYARRIGTPIVDLWGVEWWYYVREEGREEMWNKAVELFNE